MSAALLLLAATGCSSLAYDPSNAGESVVVRRDALPPELELVERPVGADPSAHISIESSARWIVWGIPWNHPNWPDLLREQGVASGGLANLRYTVEHRWDDWVVGIITLGFYRTATVTLEARSVDLVPRSALGSGSEPLVPPAPTHMPVRSPAPATPPTEPGAGSP